MPIATILIGLPGSGKTTLLEGQPADHPWGKHFDDFHGDSLDGSGAFPQSQYYVELKKELREGRNCLISDIEYCNSDRLADTEEGLRAISRELGIRLEINRIYFENNPVACRHNVVHRFSRHYIDELRKIDDLSTVYNCPTEGAIAVGTCCRDC
jgi:hypothetical protein